VSDHDMSMTGTVLHALLRDPEDQRAWANFVLRYGPKIHAWGLRWGLQESDAQEVTQVVLMKLVEHFKKPGGFAYDRGRGPFRGWLKTVAHHAWRDYLEARRRHGVGMGGSELLEQLHTVEARDDLAERLLDEARRELMAAAAEMVRREVKTRDWGIWTALVIDGRSPQDVARELGMQVETVRVIKSRIKKRLEEIIRQLEREGEDG
jgi:RNA polymerase sigma factor (sigma-70 family)